MFGLAKNQPKSSGHLPVFAGACGDVLTLLTSMSLSFGREVPGTCSSFVWGLSSGSMSPRLDPVRLRGGFSCHAHGGAALRPVNQTIGLYQWKIRFWRCIATRSSTECCNLHSKHLAFAQLIPRQACAFPG